MEIKLWAKLICYFHVMPHEKKRIYCAHISKMVTFVGNLFCRDKGGPKTCCTKWDNWITLSERYQGTPMRQCPSYLRGHTSRMKAISYFHEVFLHQNNQNITQSPKHEESRIFLRKGNFLIWRSNLVYVQKNSSFGHKFWNFAKTGHHGR